MRRRGLHLLALCSITSLLLCLTTCALWVRSYFVSDWIGRIHYAPGVPNEDHHAYLIVNRGAVTLNWGGDPAANFPLVRWTWERRPADNYFHWFAGDAPAPFPAIGIGWDKQRRIITGEYDASVFVKLELPAWLFAIATVFFASLNKWTRRHGYADGLCPVCGYDLCATPQRCPECGTSIAST